MATTLRKLRQRGLGDDVLALARQQQAARPKAAKPHFFLPVERMSVTPCFLEKAIQASRRRGARPKLRRI